MAVDNLIGADLVTADGELVRASETENTDLLWALRGGGGNVGVASSFTVRLHPVGATVYGGPIFFPYERAAELLRFYEQWTRTLPDELTTLFAIAPPEPFIPEALHGAPVAMVFLCYAGAEQAGEAAVRPLREAMPPIADLAGPIPYSALQSIGDAGAPNGVRASFRSLYFDALGEAAIDAVLKQCDALRTLHPFSTLHTHHLGGAVGRIAEGATASGRRNARYVLNVVGLGDAAERDAEHVAWVRRTSEALQPFAGSGSYLNFLTDVGEDRVRAVYGPATHARPAALKAHYDPTNLFRLNQNIRPAEGGDRQSELGPMTAPRSLPVGVRLRVRSCRRPREGLPRGPAQRAATSRRRNADSGPRRGRHARRRGPPCPPHHRSPVPFLPLVSRGPSSLGVAEDVGPDEALAGDGGVVQRRTGQPIRQRGAPDRTAHQQHSACRRLQAGRHVLGAGAAPRGATGPNRIDHRRLVHHRASLHTARADRACPVAHQNSTYVLVLRSDRINITEAVVPLARHTRGPAY